MAQLVLENISPAIVQKLEQRAKRAGRTVEAEAVRVLEADITAEGLNGAEVDVAAEPGSAPVASSGGLDGAPAMADRQAALAGAYPDEYVVLLGDRIVAHTKDKEEAYAHQDAAYGGEAEPIVIPPGALRQIPPPIVRGRAFSLASGAERR